MKRTALTRTLLYGSLLLLLWPAQLAAQDDEWGFGGAEEPLRPAKTELEVLSGAWDRPAVGPQSAPITIVEFSDFECPFCKRAQSTLKELRDAYPDKVRLVFRHLPLAFHKNAKQAGRAAEAAYQQGGFAGYKAILFENQKALDRESLIDYAERIGMDRSTFVADMDSAESRDKVDADVAWTRKLGVTGTPSFFVNGVRLVGAQPVSAFETVIKEELRRAELLEKEDLKGYRSRSEALTAINLSDARHLPNKRSQRSALQPVALNDTTSIGSTDALLTVVAFTDPADPGMARMLSVMGAIQVRYGDQLRIDWRPLPRVLDKRSETIGAMLRVAGEQSDETLHQLLYCLGELHLSGTFPEKVDGLQDAMQGCSAPPDVSPEDADDTLRTWAEEQRELAREYGVSGQHGFFLNGQRVSDPFNEDAALLVAEERYNLAKRVASEVGTDSVYDWFAATNRGGERRYVAVGKQPSSGPADAPVTVSVFTDLESVGTKDVWEVVQAVEADYGEEVRIVHYQRPRSASQTGFAAALGALAAHKQGRYADFVERVITNQHRFEEVFFEASAEELGLDMKQWQKDRNTVQKAVNTDVGIARDAGATIAPAVFVNGLVAPMKEETLRQIIDEEIAFEEEVRQLRGKADHYSWITGGFLPDEPGLGPVEKPEDAREFFDLSTRPVRGPRDALVTIVEVTDYECPYCQRVQSTLDQVAEHYGDSVRFSVVHFPLAFHKKARPAARAAWAAQRQGKFWEYHEALFTAQDDLSESELFSIADSLGLDVDQFTSDFDGRAGDKAVEEDIMTAKLAGVTGTPTMYVNGRKIGGARPFEDFARVIDEEIERAEKLLAAGQVKRKGDLYKVVTEGPDPFIGVTARVKMKGAPGIGSRRAQHQVALFVDASQTPSLEALETLGELESLSPDDVQTLVIPMAEEGAALVLTSKSGQGAAEAVETWQANLGPAVLAETLGLSEEELKERIEEADVARAMKQAAKQAEKFDVHGGPTWVIDGVPVRRNVTVEELKLWLELR